MLAVDEYIKKLADPQKTEFERIRSIVRRVAPEATESISYGMPAFKYHNQPLLYVGAFKDHMSLFPTSGPAEALKHKLTGFKVSKGTIQFTPANPIPETLIIAMLNMRLAVIAKT